MELLENETGKRFESSSVLLVHSTWFVLAQKVQHGTATTMSGCFYLVSLNSLSVLVHMQVCADARKSERKNAN